MTGKPQALPLFHSTIIIVASLSFCLPGQAPVEAEILGRAVKMHREGCPQVAALTLREFLVDKPQGEVDGEYKKKMGSLLLSCDPLSRSRASSAADLARSVEKVAGQYQAKGWTRFAARLRRRVHCLDPFTAGLRAPATKAPVTLFEGADRIPPREWRLAEGEVTSPPTDRQPALLVSKRSHTACMTLQLEVRLAGKGKVRGGVVLAYKSPQDYYEVRVEHQYKNFYFAILRQQGGAHSKLTSLYTQRSQAQRDAWQKIRITLSGNRITAVLGCARPEVLVAGGKDLTGRFGLYAETDHAPSLPVRYRRIFLDMPRHPSPGTLAPETIWKQVEVARKEKQPEEAAILLDDMLLRIPDRTRDPKQRALRRQAARLLQDLDPLVMERSRFAKKAQRAYTALAGKYARKGWHTTGMSVLDRIRMAWPGLETREMAGLQKRLGQGPTPAVPLVAQVCRGGEEFTLRGWTCRDGIASSPTLDGRTSAIGSSFSLPGRFDLGVDIQVGPQDGSGALTLAFRKGTDFTQVRVTNQDRYRNIRVMVMKDAEVTTWQELKSRIEPGKKGDWVRVRVQARGSYLRTSIPGVGEFTTWFPTPDLLSGRMGLLATDVAAKGKPVRFRNLTIKRLKNTARR